MMQLLGTPDFRLFWSVSILRNDRVCPYIHLGRQAMYKQNIQMFRSSAVESGPYIIRNQIQRIESRQVQSALVVKIPSRWVLGCKGTSYLESMTRTHKERLEHQ
jgi:hypothetical protein